MEAKTRARPKIDPSRVPDPVRMEIAKIVYRAVVRDLQRPEFQEGFRRWMEEREETI